jgi:hypothetical protein
MNDESRPPRSPTGSATTAPAADPLSGIRRLRAVAKSPQGGERCGLPAGIANQNDYARSLSAEFLNKRRDDEDNHEHDNDHARDDFLAFRGPKGFRLGILLGRLSFFHLLYSSIAWESIRTPNLASRQSRSNPIRSGEEVRKYLCLRFDYAAVRSARPLRVSFWR